MLLIYYFRIFERRFGSQRFFSRNLSILLVSTMFELAILAVAGDYLQITQLAFGPYATKATIRVYYIMDTVTGRVDA
jgi:hypothetical protein